MGARDDHIEVTQAGEPSEDHTGDGVSGDDLTTEERWRERAAGARGTGARSMLCFQLFVHGDTLGSLDPESSQPQASTDESEHVGLPFASHAAAHPAGAQPLWGRNPSRGGLVTPRG